MMSPWHSLDDDRSTSDEALVSCDAELRMLWE